MYRITLEWSERGRIRTRTISTDDQTLVPDTIRIGRGDENQCDITLTDTNPKIEKTASKVHAAIVYDSQQKAFFIHNLTRDRKLPKRPNPVIIDGKKIIQEIVKVNRGSVINLGHFLLKVKALELPPNSERFMVKCSGPKQHIVGSEYVGLNCPYCGYIVLTGTTLKS